MAQVSEDELIARCFAPLAGPGGLALKDDVALATPRPGKDLVVTKDLLVAGVHFFPDDPPDAIARKALRVNLSDLAAKAATPLGFLLGLALPRDWTLDWLQAFAAGLGEDAGRFGCPLLGGDTVRADQLTLSITAFGEIAAGGLVPRTGTRPGDLIYVSGTIGDAALGLRLRRAAPEDASWIARLDDAARAHLRERYLHPQPRLTLREAIADHASAAMDISDGLAGDLTKMLHLAGVSVTVAAAHELLSPAGRRAVDLDEALLATALTGGDDYEILAAVPPDQAEAFEQAAATAGVPVRAIGRTVPGRHEPAFFNAKGERISFSSLSYNHF